jgi:hypothetical protein
VSQYFILTRIFRFLLVILKIKSIRTIYNNIITFVPYMGDLMGILTIEFLFFAALGQNLLSGKYVVSK